MARNELKNNVHIYKKRHNINIGVVLFGVILFYLLVTIVSYVTARHVTAYEVREGTILKDNSYTGFIIREESVINAADTGYVNFFATEATKVGKLTNTYSISENELNFEQNENNAEEDGIVELSSEEQNAIILKAQTFSDSYQETHYDDVYQFLDSIEKTISTNSSQSRQAQLETMILNGTPGISVYPAVDDGVIVYSVDGYEQLELNELTEDMISRANYQKTEIYNNTKVNAGDPVYKLITSEDWKLLIKLDDEMAEELAENTSIRVRFKKDNQIARAGFTIEKTKKITVGILSFDHSMVRYATERFLDIELIIEDESGLKIPKSAVVEKEFYLVPEDYITQGGNSNSSGVLVKGKENNLVFTEADIYYRDTETGMVYLQKDLLKNDGLLIKPDSNETYKLEKTATLSGVYNINKGYAVFRHVNILCESDEYYIVKSGNTYGLTNYDHIALDGESVQENDVVF